MDIKIPDKFVTLPVTERPDGSIEISPHRLPFLALGVPFLAAGLALWAYQLRDANVTDPAQWFVAILLSGPGMYLLARGCQPRIMLIADSAGLIVRYGFPFLEKQMLRFEAAELELHTNKWIGGKHPLFVLEARNRGQDAWLALAGSRLESEVEAARLAILEVMGKIGEKPVDAEDAAK